MENFVINNQLLKFRKLSGSTQQQIADEIGISKNSYSQIERGETCPSLWIAVALSLFYGVSIETLFFVQKTISPTKYGYVHKRGRK